MLLKEIVSGVEIKCYQYSSDIRNHRVHLVIEVITFELGIEKNSDLGK